MRRKPRDKVWEVKLTSITYEYTRAQLGEIMCQHARCCFSECNIKLKEQHDKDMVQYINVKAEALVSVLASLNDANSHRNVVFLFAAQL